MPADRPPRSRTAQSTGLGRLLALLAVCAAFPSTVGRAATITGEVKPARGVTAVSAVDRQSNKRFPGTCDAATGKFRIEELPGDATYDCILDFGDVRLEGVSLKVPRSDYEEEQPLSDEDLETIRTKVLSMNKFEDKIEIMTIRGNIQHASILLNKRRTKPFFDSKPGQIIWRAELWHFERPEDTWLKVQDEMFIVLYRERIQATEYEAKSITFDPALGGVGLATANATADVGTIAPPESKPGVRLRGVADAEKESVPLERRP